MIDRLWELWQWLDALDEVLILRVSYTVSSLLGIPCALWCLWASIQSSRVVARAARAGMNGGLLRAARGYRRRDLYYCGVLLLTATAGLIAMFANLPLRTPFGLAVWLVIAVWTTLTVLADYNDRQVTVDREIPEVSP